MNELLPCPGCSRHVRACESTCPFCAQALSFPCVVKRGVMPGKRLNRAALFALGAGVVGATTFSSCVVPVYGSPGFPEGGESFGPTPSPREEGGAGGQGGESSHDDGNPEAGAGDRNFAVYGGPPGGDGNF